MRSDRGLLLMPIRRIFRMSVVRDSSFPEPPARQRNKCDHSMVKFEEHADSTPIRSPLLAPKEVFCASVHLLFRNAVYALEGETFPRPQRLFLTTTMRTRRFFLGPIKWTNAWYSSPVEEP